MEKANHLYQSEHMIGCAKCGIGFYFAGAAPCTSEDEKCPAGWTQLERSIARSHWDGNVITGQEAFLSAATILRALSIGLPWPPLDDTRMPIAIDWQPASRPAQISFSWSAITGSREQRASGTPANHDSCQLPGLAPLPNEIRFANLWLITVAAELTIQQSPSRSSLSVGPWPPEYLGDAHSPKVFMRWKACNSPHCVSLKYRLSKGVLPGCHWVNGLKSKA